MGKPYNIHPDLIRSTEHLWAKTMITSTQTSSVPQSIHGPQPRFRAPRPHPLPSAPTGQSHDNVHPDIIRPPQHPGPKTMITSAQTSSSPPDHPWVNHDNVHLSHIRSPVHPWVNHDINHPDLILSPEHPWVTYDNVHADLVLSSEHPFANCDKGNPGLWR